jgi:PKD repeat protein
MGFGLEAVNSSAGNATRAQIADRVLDWLLDNVTVSLPSSVFRISPARPATLTATASSSLGTITQYRWDFGDGTPIETTTTGTVSHRFRSPRSTVLVEVTDSLGHRAVASMLASVTGR